jgi:Protein of unknown function (DUF2997)
MFTVFVTIVVVVLSTLATAIISIEAFHPSVAVIPPHCYSATAATTHQYQMSSFSSKCNSELLFHPHGMKRSVPMTLHQAADAWTGGGSGSDSTTAASRLASGGGYGNIEQMEYKIYPDGRVEELVRGIKGNNCHKVTQSIHEQLGEVVATQPTEEMYEQEVQVSQTLYNTDSTSGGDWSSSSW